jgi:hypothetical protein
MVYILVVAVEDLIQYGVMREPPHQGLSNDQLIELGTHLPVKPGDQEPEEGIPTIWQGLDTIYRTDPMGRRVGYGKFPLTILN